MHELVPLIPVTSFHMDEFSIKEAKTAGWGEGAGLTQGTENTVQVL